MKWGLLSWLWHEVKEVLRYQLETGKTLAAFWPDAVVFFMGKVSVILLLLWRRPEHLIKRSARFILCFKLVLENLPNFTGTYIFCLNPGWGFGVWCDLTGCLRDNCRLYCCKSCGAPHPHTLGQALPVVTNEPASNPRHVNWDHAVAHRYNYLLWTSTQCLCEMDSLSVPQSVSAAVLVCLCSSITRFSCFDPFDLSSGRLGDVYYAQPQLNQKTPLEYASCILYRKQL